MTQPDPAGAERQLSATAAALLDASGRRIDALSRPMTVLAFAGLLAPLVVPVPVASLCVLVVAALAGLAGAYAGIRIAFDAALFRGLADEVGSIALLDEALLRLGVLPAQNVGRPLDERLSGTKRLLLRHALLLALQAGALLVAGLVGLSRH